MEVKTTNSLLKNTKLGDFAVYNMIKTKMDGEEDKSLPIHFVQTYDRSGSMYSDIKGLVKNIKETINLMEQGDILTILWYSGRGEKGVVIEGHRVTKTDGELEYLEKILEKNNYTLGATMYSEVIDLANHMITKYSNLSPNAAVSFFTDGGVNMESKQNVFTAVENIVKNPNCMSFNTIGYGKYYDPEILKDMAAISPQGQYFHNSGIKDYLDTYAKKVQINKGYSVGSIEVKNLETKAIDVLFMTDNTSTVKTLQPNETIKFRASKRDAKILSNGSINIDVKDKDFEQNLNISPNDDLRVVRKDSFEKIVYGMVTAYYSANKRDTALDLVEFDIKDLNLYRRLANAFTTTEVGESTEYSRLVFGDSDLRNPNTINGSISDGISIMQILNKAAELNLSFDINTIKENYNSISQKREVEQNLFVETNSNNIVPITDITFNTKGKLNASVLLSREGYLDLSNISNKPAELDDQFITKRYNRYNIIQDGTYRANVLPIVTTSNVASKEFKDFLFKNDISFEAKGTSINVDMKDIPMITRSEAKQFNSFEKFAKLYVDTEVQKLQTYVVKQVIDILKKESGAAKGDVKSYSDQTKNFLKEIGIGYDGSYSPKTGAAIPMTDIFEYRILNFELNGLKSTTGKIAEYYNYTPGSRVSQVKQILNNCYKVVEKEINEKLGIDIKSIVENKYESNKAQSLFDTLEPFYREKQKLTEDLSRNIESIRFGKVITGSFFDDLKQEDDKFFVEYNNSILGDGKLFVSVEKITEGGEPAVDQEEMDSSLSR